MVSKEVAIATYVGAGLLLSSGLHTYYTRDFYEKIRFGLPMIANPDVELPRQAGYVGSFMAAVGGFLALYLYMTAVLPPLAQQTVQTMLVNELQRFAVVIVGVVLWAQVVGGASWSKFFLDGVLLFLSFVAILSFVYPLPFLTTVSLFLVSLGSLLAGGWSIWSREFVEPRVQEDDDTDPAESNLVYPHFPSFAYFVICSLYNVSAFFYILVSYWNFQT